MPVNFTEPPYSYFAPPGVVRVSPQALEMARSFGRQVAHAGRSNRLVAFDWAFSRSIRRHVDEPMEELGPGLDLVCFECAQVPSEAIHRVDGVAFAIKIPEEVYGPSAERLIDVDERAFSNLVLR